MFHDDEMTGTEGCFSFLSVFIGWRWPLGVSECATLSGLGPWARLGGARGVTSQLFPVWGIIFRHAQALLIFLDVQIAASVYSNKHDGKNNIPCERTGTARGTGTIAFPCRTQNRRENSRKKAHRVAPENSKELTIQGEKKNRKL
jgi:hypothetical protein